MKTIVMEKLVQFTYALLLILAISVGFATVIGLIDIGNYFLLIFRTDAVSSYEIFSNFLAHALLLVIGVELILMLLSRSTASVLELLLFVIARKMLIYSGSMLDLIWGTAAIAGIFAIRKYLNSDDELIAGNGHIFSAGTRVSDVLVNTGINIPADKELTVGGLACSLADEACKPVDEGAEFEAGNVLIKVLKARQGVIEKVLISEKDGVSNKNLHIV